MDQESVYGEKTITLTASSVSIIVELLALEIKWQAEGAYYLIL